MVCFVWSIRIGIGPPNVERRRLFFFLVGGIKQKRSPARLGLTVQCFVNHSNLNS